MCRQGCWSRQHIFAAILQPSPFCHSAAPQLGNVYICMSRPLTTKDMNDRHASTCKAIGLKNALPGAKSWQHASLSKLDVSELRGMFCPFSSSCTGRFTFLKLLGNVKSRLLSGEETLHSLRKDLVHACTRMHLLANMHPVHLSITYWSYSCAQHHSSRVVTYSNQISTMHSAVGTQVNSGLGLSSLTTPTSTQPGLD